MSAADEKTPELKNQTTYMVDCFAERSGIINVELRRATESISKWVFDTRENCIREALVKLGWTPPGEWPKKMNEAAKRGEGCGCRNCIDCSAYHVQYRGDFFGDPGSEHRTPATKLVEPS